MDGLRLKEKYEGQEVFDVILPITKATVTVYRKGEKNQLFFLNTNLPITHNGKSVFVEEDGSITSGEEIRSFQA